MLELIKKCLAYHLTPQDVISYVSKFLRNRCSGVWGSFLFSIKAKFYGVKCQGKVNVYGTVHLIRAPLSQIVFGINVSIVSSSYRATAASIFAPTKLQTFSKTSLIKIGDNVGLNGTSIVARSRSVIIGNGTMIAPNVTIMDSDFHALWPFENRATSPAFENDKDVIIGKNVWIGAQCIILKGVNIGDNSVIGAGSIVTRNVPENVVAAGNPAKVIKQL